ncbi:MAG TPA: hypothetical protein VEU51_14355, partial [Candidatus Acidoferrales bacterium]|nr:hypothetical protein [Candidatus Acidoferrales bacterium]
MHPRSQILRAALAIALANAGWLVWANRFPPLQDYPDWLYQGWILSRMLAGHAPAGYRIAPYPVPNTIVTLTLGLLDLATSPETAGKLVVTFAIATFIAGSLFVMTALNKSERNPLLLVPLVFVFNYFLLGGELAYLLGLGIFFLFAGYLIRTLPSPEHASPGLIVIASCALFFTHIAAYAAAGLVLIAVVCANRRRIVLFRVILPLIPSGLLLTWSFVGQKLQNGPAA